MVIGVHSFSNEIGERLELRAAVETVENWVIVQKIHLERRKIPLVKGIDRG